MSSEAVTYENLRLSTYEVEHITYLSLSKMANDHGSLELIAILTDDVADRYIYLTEELIPVKLSYIDEEDKEIILFQGLVTNLQVSKQGGVFYMQLAAKSNTCLMAIEQKSRSFQNIEMTTHQVINEVLSGYEQAAFIPQIPDEPIGALLIQYQETDWAFLKRLVSRYGAVMISEVRSEGIACFAGVPEQEKPVAIESFQYTISKSIESYQIMKKNDWAEVNEIEYIVFRVSNWRIFQVGDCIELDNKILYVEQAYHLLEDGILKNDYVLKLKEGFKALKLYNVSIVGSSLSGTVAAVARDRIMVDLEIDVPGRACYWFPYSTMSASPDGSGWYCMPEKGDNVRVYLPSKVEGEAYAISSISGYQPSAGSDKTKDPMADPQIKHLSTVYDKVISFAEEGILINADSGQAAVFLGKDGTLSVYGASSINVTAEDTVAIKAKNDVVIGAVENVMIKNGKASIELSRTGNIIMKGKKIYSN